MIKIYTDGSFIDGKCGYGAAVTENGEIIHRISGNISNSGYLKHRQVAGEVFAVIKSLEWCKMNSISECEICYDYQGVESWATGEWKRNTELTKHYHNLTANNQINVTWVKVKAHSGDTFNEEADQLAKQGCFLANDKENTPKTNNSGKNEALQFNTLFAEAENVALRFTAFLVENDIDAYYAGFFNKMYARIEIGTGKSRTGLIDIYNTQKKHLKPDYRGFKESVGKVIIETLWTQFTKKIK